MKKILSMVVISAMVMSAGSVLADSFTVGAAGNIQNQTQVMGGVDLGANGALSGINQDQGGVGASASTPMSVAAEGQIQGENTTVTGTNGFATHSYDSTAVTGGASGTIGGGLGVHVETQSVDGGIATLGDGTGTGSISGSAMQINQGVAAGGVGIAGGASFAGADYNSDYSYTNSGTTSTITQTGTQDSVMLTAAGGSNGGGVAGLQATQVGGTAASNDANGTSMSGGSAAVGSIETVNTVGAGAGGSAAAGSLGVQSQNHSYTQSSSNGVQSQWATGSVMTGNAVNDSVVLP